MSDVIVQFVDRLETELACRANELQNFQVANICHDFTEYIQELTDRPSMAAKDEIKLVLLLSELRENVQKNVQVYEVGEFLSIYCAYVYSMLFSISSNSQVERAQSTNERNKLLTLGSDFVGLHSEFV